MSEASSSDVPLISSTENSVSNVCHLMTGDDAQSAPSMTKNGQADSSMTQSGIKLEPLKARNPQLLQQLEILGLLTSIREFVEAETPTSTFFATLRKVDQLRSIFIRTYGNTSSPSECPQHSDAWGLRRSSTNANSLSFDCETRHLGMYRALRTGVSTEENLVVSDGDAILSSRCISDRRVINHTNEEPSEELKSDHCPVPLTAFSLHKKRYSGLIISRATPGAVQDDNLCLSLRRGKEITNLLAHEESESEDRPVILQESELPLSLTAADPCTRELFKELSASDAGRLAALETILGFSSLESVFASPKDMQSIARYLAHQFPIPADLGATIGLSSPRAKLSPHLTDHAVALASVCDDSVLSTQVWAQTKKLVKTSAKTLAKFEFFIWSCTREVIRLSMSQGNDAIHINWCSKAVALLFDFVRLSTDPALVKSSTVALTSVLSLAYTLHDQGLQSTDQYSSWFLSAESIMQVIVCYINAYRSGYLLQLEGCNLVLANNLELSGISLPSDLSPKDNILVQRFLVAWCILGFSIANSLDVLTPPFIVSTYLPLMAVAEGFVVATSKLYKQYAGLCPAIKCKLGECYASIQANWLRTRTCLSSGQRLELQNTGLSMFSENLVEDLETFCLYMN